MLHPELKLNFEVHTLIYTHTTTCFHRFLNSFTLGNYVENIPIYISRFCQKS